MAKEEYSAEIRAQIVTLVIIAKMKPQDIALLLNMPLRSVYNIIKHAKEQGETIHNTGGPPIHCSPLPVFLIARPQEI